MKIEKKKKSKIKTKKNDIYSDLVFSSSSTFCEKCFLEFSKPLTKLVKISSCFSDDVLLNEENY